MLELLFWTFSTPAALLALLSIRSGRKFQDHVQGEILGEPDPDEQPYRPPATVILPVRGLDHDLAANLHSLADQDYPDYELLVVSREADDSAIAAARVTLGERARFIEAGPPPTTPAKKSTTYWPPSNKPARNPKSWHSPTPTAASAPAGSRTSSSP